MESSFFIVNYLQNLCIVLCMGPDLLCVLTLTHDAESSHPTFQLEQQLLSKGFFVFQRSFAMERAPCQLAIDIFIYFCPFCFARRVWPKRRGRVSQRVLYPFAYLPPLLSKPQPVPAGLTHTPT